MNLTVEEKRKVLERIPKIKMEIMALRMETENLKEEATSLSHPYSDIGPVDGGKNKTGARFEPIIDRIADYEMKNSKKIEALRKEISRIRMNIDSLESDEKAVIIFHYFTGLSYRQIASELHCSERTVGRLMIKALKNLEL